MKIMETFRSPKRVTQKSCTAPSLQRATAPRYLALRFAIPITQGDLTYTERRPSRKTLCEVAVSSIFVRASKTSSGSRSGHSTCQVLLVPQEVTAPQLFRTRLSMLNIMPLFVSSESSITSSRENVCGTCAKATLLSSWYSSSSFRRKNTGSTSLKYSGVGWWRASKMAKRTLPCPAARPASMPPSGCTEPRGRWRPCCPRESRACGASLPTAPSGGESRPRFRSSCRAKFCAPPLPREPQKGTVRLRRSLNMRVRSSGSPAHANCRKPSL
mmetsp:Transcript_27047/g.84153  ORF Transcript_27047/g.84153 Transcript_27047/m.84153 type:complete len:271 (+) Transcript_27047:1064-1876(+)